MSDALIVGLIAFVIVVVLSRIFKTDIPTMVIYLLIFGTIGVPFLQLAGSYIIPWLHSLGINL